MTEQEAFRLAFGPRPEPELDGAGRAWFAELMRLVGAPEGTEAR